MVIIKEMDYLYPDKYPEHYKETLDFIRTMIYTQLQDYPNFKGIDFCDAHSDEILIRGWHKEIKQFAYCKVSLKYDFSNWKQATKDFIHMWKKYDNPQHLKEYKEFLHDGEQYGWD